MQLESEFLEPDGLLEDEKHVLMAGPSIIDTLRCLWPICATCNNNYSMVYKVHMLMFAGKATIERNCSHVLRLSKADVSTFERMKANCRRIFAL